MATFKVGDKVRHAQYGPGEVTYGPIKSASSDNNRMVVRFDNDERIVTPTYLSAAVPALKVGDKVRTSSGAGTIEAGPFIGRGSGRTWHVITVDGKQSWAFESDLLKIVDEAIKVGDVVRVLMDNANHARVKAGEVFKVKGVSGSSITVDRPDNDDPWGRTWYFDLKNVEKATDVIDYNGVLYDTRATYTDNDGDDWTFDGGTSNGAHTRMVSASDYGPQPLHEVVSEYGPLTRN